MYLKKKKKNGKIYYEVVKTENGKQIHIMSLGSLETMMKHKQMANGTYDILGGGK